MILEEELPIDLGRSLLLKTAERASETLDAVFHILLLHPGLGFVRSTRCNVSGVVVHVRLYLKIHCSKKGMKALELKEGALWRKMCHLSDGLLISLQKMGDELFPRKDGKIVTSDVDYVDVWRVRRYSLYACLNNSTE